MRANYFFSRLSAIIAVTMLALALGNVAKADSLTFTGPYAVGNWTTSLANSNGGVDTSLAPSSITVLGSNNGDIMGNFNEGYTIFTIVVPATTTLTFNWLYQSFDDGGSFWDPAGYKIDNQFFQLSTDSQTPGGPMSGTTTVSLMAGQIFGFYVHSLDNIHGAANLTIFSGPVSSVPEPSSIALLSIGLLLAAAFSLRGFAGRSSASPSVA